MNGTQNFASLDSLACLFSVTPLVLEPRYGIGKHTPGRHYAASVWLSVNKRRRHNLNGSIEGSLFKKGLSLSLSLSLSPSLSRSSSLSPIPWTLTLNLPHPLSLYLTHFF